MSDRDEIVSVLRRHILDDRHAEVTFDDLRDLFREKPWLANALLTECYIAVPGGRAVTYRDAGSGRYTTKADAEARPKETVRERSKSKSSRS